MSDAAASLLDFIPSLGTREVFAFGAGVALPTRMRFLELTPDKRPNSEASGSTQSQAGLSMDRDLLTSVIDRWRSASMSQRISDDLYDDGSAAFEAPALQPGMQPAISPAHMPPAHMPPAPPTPPNLGSQYVQAPAPSYAPVTAAPYTAQPAAPPQRPDSLRSSLLKKPLDQLGSGNTPNKPILPSRFR